MDKPPNYIKINSDNNILKLVSIELKSKTKKDDTYTYQYIKSETKKGNIDFVVTNFNRLFGYSISEIKEDEI
jgi:hypothetical protein